MNQKFYITAAIPYVNAAPHIGHALEFVQTDVIARYHRLLGDDVLVLSGGDENALKNVQAAQKAGIPIQQFVDHNTQKFYELTKSLNCRFDIWQKGSDQIRHYPSSQKLWTLCQKDIYRKKYSGLYCVGCEVFYTPDELDENGQCLEHPGKKLETVEEKNYFFKLSKYQEQLKKLLTGDEVEIVPEKRKNEVLAFVDKGLTDISISRTNERARNWGVPVPSDPTQRIYVWFDALNIYQSGVGFGWDEQKYSKWWPADVHVIGKGIVRFHAIYWIAFLLSAGLKLPKAIFVHEYFTVKGQKMSKTVGNVIDPGDLIKKYGADPLRYYFLAQFSPFSDGDFSESQFKKTYNADLANGLGNLVSRIVKLLEINNVCCGKNSVTDFSLEVKTWIEEYRFDMALKTIWERITGLDRLINNKKPWEKTGLHKQVLWNELIDGVRQITYDLQPFLPVTAEKIHKQFSERQITSQPPLFPRLI